MIYIYIYICGIYIYIYIYIYDIYIYMAYIYICDIYIYIVYIYIEIYIYMLYIYIYISIHGKTITAEIDSFRFKIRGGTAWAPNHQSPLSVDISDVRWKGGDFWCFLHQKGMLYIMGNSSENAGKSTITQGL